ncbi:hypothetical protein ACHAPQ_011373 [Fusarium lateritium]
MTRLSGKVAIVTGGGSGFGAGIVAKFVSEGCKVVVMDIDKSLASEAAAKAPSGSAVAIRGDVSQRDDWVVALDTALVNFGSLDIVVNNAGVLHMAQPSIDMDEDEYDRIMRVNATKGLAAEYASAKIRFNAIMPSVGETNMCVFHEWSE